MVQSQEKVSGLFGSPGGGKIRLPQRPEVSSEQATALPLPNGLRQPLFLRLLFSVRRFAFFGKTLYPIHPLGLKEIQ